MTYFLNSCETDCIKVKAEHSMHSSHRNTTKDEALCYDILRTSIILVFDYKLVFEVNLSIIILFSVSVLI